MAVLTTCIAGRFLAATASFPFAASLAALIQLHKMATKLALDSKPIINKIEIRNDQIKEISDL